MSDDRIKYEEYRNIYEQNKDSVNWADKYQMVLRSLKRRPSILAREIGFSNENVFMILSGSSRPSFSMLADTVRFMHVNPDWLIADQADAPVLRDSFRARDTNGHIARRITDLLDGASRYAFASRTGVDYQMIRRITDHPEEENTEISENAVHRIADTCSVGFEWIFCGDEKAKENPVNQKMTDWLEEHPHFRKPVYLEMQGRSDKNGADKLSERVETYLYDVLSKSHASEPGERIRLIRNVYDCSLRDFATISGVSKSTISNWENGKNKPDSFAMRRICESLNIGEKWIADGDVEAMRWPVDKRMIEFLKERPDIRKNIIEKMN